MRSYDQIMADARDGSPFSNGTSGEIWMDGWCYRCKVDAPYQRDEAQEGCPLIVVALIQKTPVEWTETGLQDYDCSEFISDDGWGDDEPEDGPEPGPQPAAAIDGQIDMFELFADQIAVEAAREPVMS